MDSFSLKNYRERWRVVNAIETNERRQTPLLVRWKQLNHLFNMALDMGVKPGDIPGEIEIVRQRWKILKGTAS